MKSLALLLLSFLYCHVVLADYADNALTAIRTLQEKYYDFDTGLWDDLWWQSGNIVEVIAKFGLEDESFRPTAVQIISNTYNKSPNQHGADAWKNRYYDDMGWWAMGWIASYDLTGDVKFLNTAKDLFQDMTGGWSTPCNGGLWWDKTHDYISAISNELFLSVSAHLANRVSPDEREEYLNWAQMEWDWFRDSGIINEAGLVNDGIRHTDCQNNGRDTWTYNQGVVLAGLSEMARAKKDGGFIDHANRIADAAMARLTTNGILAEPVDRDLDKTAAQFKGAFMRGLSTLNENEKRQEVTDFIKKNADAVWSRERQSGGIIVSEWRGGKRNANAGSHAAGIDVLVAAFTAP